MRCTRESNLIWLLSEEKMATFWQDKVIILQISCLISGFHISLVLRHHSDLKLSILE